MGLGNDGQRLPAALATILAGFGTAAGATFIAVKARGSRWSLPLTGRPARAGDVVVGARAAGAAPHERQRTVTETSQVGSRA
jgi:hypothetical protein